MENFNFISIKYYENEEKHKIKSYKIFFCTLWFASIVLFGTFVILNNSLKELKNGSAGKAAAEVRKENTLKKNYNTINTFSEFHNNIGNNANVKAVSINEKQVMLNIEVLSKEEYSSFISQLESNDKYNILYLSPLNLYNSRYSFKLTLEAQK